MNSYSRNYIPYKIAFKHYGIKYYSTELEAISLISVLSMNINDHNI